MQLGIVQSPSSDLSTHPQPGAVIAGGLVRTSVQGKLRSAFCKEKSFRVHNQLHMHTCTNAMLIFRRGIDSLPSCPTCVRCRWQMTQPFGPEGL